MDIQNYEIWQKSLIITFDLHHNFCTSSWSLKYDFLSSMVEDALH